MDIELKLCHLQVACVVIFLSLSSYLLINFHMAGEWQHVSFYALFIKPANCFRCNSLRSAGTVDEM